MFYYSRSKMLHTLLKYIFTQKYFTIAMVLAIAPAYQYSYAQAAVNADPEPEPEPVISAAYQTNCAACHGSHLEGGFAGSLINDSFREKWKQLGETALLKYVSSTMPTEMPGSLLMETYISAVNDIIITARIGDPLTPSIAAQDDLWPEDVIEMDVDWVSRLPVNQDAIADAENLRVTALLQGIKPVTQDMLENVDNGDWLHWRRTYSGHGYSPLQQINRENVAELEVAWALALPFGTNAITPLVHDGVMFVNSNGTVRAIEARSGDILWQYARPVERRWQMSQPRNLAISGTTLFVPTSDVHMIALDIRTGSVLWDHAIEPEGTPIHLTAGPLVVRDKVIQGASGCADAENVSGCFIAALDTKTGREVWRFNTIARPGEPGGNSWNGAPLEKRFGASVWSTGSYDPELDLVFIGTSQTYNVATLIEPQSDRGDSADALYTNSTLALDPDTGELVWYFQHFQGDLWDLDWAFERMIVSLPTPSGEKKVVVTVGKLGIFDVLDAKTGGYLFSHDMGLQDLVERIDPQTGRKTARQDAALRRGDPVFVCPSSLGVRN